MGRVGEALREKRSQPFTTQEKDIFEMKVEHAVHSPAIDQTAASQAAQIAAMVLTVLLAAVWVYFGRLYLIQDAGELKIANLELGYPLYIIPLIGVAQILGGIGLLVPNVPRLTEWVYAGFVINLLLAFYSQLHSGGSTWDKFDPLLVMGFVLASYVLRRRMRANQWSL
jgi:uncharacterized membrane protein YphA (DoxX/SURF4 family)